MIHCRRLGAVVAVLLLIECATAAEHRIAPHEPPQAVLDRAAPGDRLVFLPGLHQHKLGKHRALLYVDKSIDIELQAGATLQLAAGETTLEKTPEITTDHGAPKKLDDLAVGGDYDLSRKQTIFTLVIDGEGREGRADTFAWGVGSVFDKRVERVPITGDWQELIRGVKVRFEHTSGHNRGSLWFISYDGRESYGIRIGHGLQPEVIENVRIFGPGTIDLNASHNVVPSEMVKDINACVLVHGRVRKVAISDITMTDTMRSVMLYGEHTGKFLAGGGVTPGESFDAENITIRYTRTINPTGSGYLLGHPSHRGQLRNVRCNHNYMETATTAIEPNFNLVGYEVIDNVIKSRGQAIHCWRKSTDGLVADNLRIDDITGLEVVMANSPGGWEPPARLVQRNNRNHLSAQVKDPPASFEIAAAPGDKTANITNNDAAEIRHSFLGVGKENKAVIVAEDGAIAWSLDLPASDGWVLPNGNILLALYGTEGFPNGGVVEVERATKKIVFQYVGQQKETSTVQLLPDGTFLVAELGPEPRAVVINRAGEVVKSTPLACQKENFHMQTRMLRRLPSGNYLAPHLFDFAVKEYNPATGEVVRQFATDERGRDQRDWPFTAIRLANGNTLVACTNGNRVIELDAEGKIVWSVTNDDIGEKLFNDACGAQRLPNGNTVISSYHATGDQVKLFEVTRDKKVVWRYSGMKNGFHHFQILTTSGQPVKENTWK